MYIWQKRGFLCIFTSFILEVTSYNHLLPFYTFSLLYQIYDNINDSRRPTSHDSLFKPIILSVARRREYIRPNWVNTAYTRDMGGWLGRAY
jgi:hypothetical protein